MLLNALLEETVTSKQHTVEHAVRCNTASKQPSWQAMQGL